MTKGEDTKQAILDRAASLASRIGLEALSIGRLAEGLGHFSAFVSALLSNRWSAIRLRP